MFVLELLSVRGCFYPQRDTCNSVALCAERPNALIVQFEVLVTAYSVNYFVMTIIVLCELCFDMVDS